MGQSAVEEEIIRLHSAVLDQIRIAGDAALQDVRRTAYQTGENNNLRVLINKNISTGTRTPTRWWRSMASWVVSALLRILRRDHNLYQEHRPDPYDFLSRRAETVLRAGVPRGHEPSGFRLSRMARRAADPSYGGMCSPPPLVRGRRSAPEGDVPGIASAGQDHVGGRNHRDHGEQDQVRTDTPEHPVHPWQRGDDPGRGESHPVHDHRTIRRLSAGSGHEQRCRRNHRNPDGRKERRGIMRGLPHSDWKYVSLVPESTFVERVRPVRIVSMACLGLCVLLGGAAAYMFARRSYNPVACLMQLLEHPADPSPGA